MELCVSEGERTMANESPEVRVYTKSARGRNAQVPRWHRRSALKSGKTNSISLSVAQIEYVEMLFVKWRSILLRDGRIRTVGHLVLS
jgi:hypothetical protein